MVKLTYYDWGDAMIQEMREEYKEKMSRENHTYRICWKLYDELTDLFCNESPISEDFKTFLVRLEKKGRNTTGGITAGDVPWNAEWSSTISRMVI